MTRWDLQPVTSGAPCWPWLQLKNTVESIALRGAGLLRRAPAVSLLSTPRSPAQAPGGPQLLSIHLSAHAMPAQLHTPDRQTAAIAACTAAAVAAGAAGVAFCISAAAAAVGAVDCQAAVLAAGDRQLVLYRCKQNCIQKKGEL